MTLEAAESGVEPPGGDVVGDVEPGVEGTRGRRRRLTSSCAGEEEYPETALICTFMPPEQ